MAAKGVDGEKWVIALANPNQKEDKETNLKFVRRISSDCATRRGWAIADYTSKSNAEIEESLFLSAAQLHENHVKAVQNVLPKLPPYSLRLIRWGASIKLQLSHYLGDDNYALFMELHNACNKVWKPQALASFDPKMRSGFVFEMATDDRIIKALMQCKGIEYFKVHSLTLVQQFDDGVSHLIDGNESRFIGLKLNQVDMSELNFETQAWQLALIDDEIYWVDNFYHYITSWLEEKEYSVFYRVCIPKTSSITGIITFFHLEKWFKEFAQTCLAGNELQASFFGNLKAKTSAAFWLHPADKLISYINRFRNRGGDWLINLIGLSEKEWCDRLDAINNLKKAYAFEHLQDLKSQAIEIVACDLMSKYDKKGLIELAQREPVVIKKSWTKEKIVSEIVDQEYAFKKLGIEE